VILDFPYALSDDDALDRLHALADYWSAKHGVAARWDGADAYFDGKVKGVKFDGKVSIGGGRVHADVKTGFLAEKLGGKAYVKRKLTDYLDPANSLEELRSRVPR
jgi:hypothetical protein